MSLAILSEVDLGVIKQSVLVLLGFFFFKAAQGNKPDFD